MLLLALSCCEVPVPSLLLEFGSIPAQHRSPGPAWQPELSKEPAWNNGMETEVMVLKTQGAELGVSPRERGCVMESWNGSGWKGP